MIRYTEYLDNGTSLTVKDMCFRQVRHGSVNRVEYDAIRYIPKEAVDDRAEFCSTWLVDTRVTFTWKHYLGVNDLGSATDRVMWTINMSKIKAKDLLYLTALRYPEKYPEVPHWLYEARESFSNDMNRFTRFQEWHAKTKIGYGGGENLFDPSGAGYVVGGFKEPISLASFQERLLNNHAAKVHDHFGEPIGVVPPPPVRSPIPAPIFADTPF